jgi:predicted deacetylase
LGSGEASARARNALDELRSLGTDPTGFVAPGWSMSSEALSVLDSVGFEYTTTRLSVIDLVDHKSLSIPALCHRPNSLLSGPAARMLVSVVALRCREGRSIRLALHPDDTHDDRLVDATDRAIEVLGTSSTKLMTYGELIVACRSSPRGASGESAVPAGAKPR